MLLPLPDQADLVKRARAKQLAPDEFQSGTFTISNLGNFGADVFDAILPPGAPDALLSKSWLCCGLTKLLPSMSCALALCPWLYSPGMLQ